MALNLQIERRYKTLPEIPIRVRKDDVSWLDVSAMLDTGSAVSLLDAELADALGLLDRKAHRLTLLGIGGTVHRVPAEEVEVWILPWQFGLRATLTIGFVRGLATSTGNLLGRDFFELVHFGMDHRQRAVYLGRARRR